MDLRAHHIGLVVSDLERSLAFYRALGFEVESELPMEDGSRSITFTRLGDFRLELFWYAETPEPLAQGETKRVGFRHLALKTDDIVGVVAELKRQALVGKDAQVREVLGRYKLLFLHDPDGIEVEIMEET